MPKFKSFILKAYLYAGSHRLNRLEKVAVYIKERHTPVHRCKEVVERFVAEAVLRVALFCTDIQFSRSIRYSMCLYIKKASTVVKKPRDAQGLLEMLLS